MMKKILALVVLVMAAAGGYLLQQKWTGEPADALPESRIAFALPDLDGNMRDLSEWDGQARLVNFWATWCAPCRREIPLLKKTQAAHGADTLQVIGVAVDFQEDVVAYAETAEFNYPILIGQEDAMAAAETSGSDFVGLPVTMLVSADGELIKMHMGEILEKHIEQIVDVVSRMQRGELDLEGAQHALGKF
ncbi:MAG: TlpA disulfide reductase family protein [Woeseia sp.]